MRVAMMSDSHGEHEHVKIPDADMLIHCGDFSMAGSLTDLVKFADWFKKQPHEYKVCVAGNHDFVMEENYALGKRILRDAGVVYLENEEVSLGGLLIWGSPITPTFGHWSFMRDRGDEIERVWKQIPEHLDILITHGPPMGILDQLPRPSYQNVGCYDLLQHAKRSKPKLHCFGHIHNGGGGQVEEDGTLFVNCAVMDEDYDVVRDAVVVDIS